MLSGVSACRFQRCTRVHASALDSNRLLPSTFDMLGQTYVWIVSQLWVGRRVLKLWGLNHTSVILHRSGEVTPLSKPVSRVCPLRYANAISTHYSLALTTAVFSFALPYSVELDGR